jgi:tripartite-type tricarboxylate transporter receptor subunit TctC
MYLVRPRGLVAVLALAVLAVPPAYAAGYPDKPISLIEPYPAGSISDIGARLLARQLSTELGQPVRVIAAPGANTAVGAAKLQQGNVDGTSLFWDIVSQLGYVIASKQLPYTAADFQGIAMLGGESLAIIARADDDRFATVADMVSYAKGHPGTLSVADSGDGDSKKVLDDLEAAAQIKTTGIPYAGGSTIMTAVLGGHVDLGITAPSNIANNDKLRVLMVASSAKTYAPIPAAATAGAAGYDIDSPLLRGVFVKKGTPTEVIGILDQATEKVLQSTEWHEFSQRFSQIEAPGGPTIANSSLEKEVARWESYLKANR